MTKWFGCALDLRQNWPCPVTQWSWSMTPVLLFCDTLLLNCEALLFCVTLWLSVWHYFLVWDTGLLICYPVYPSSAAQCYCSKQQRHATVLISFLSWGWILGRNPDKRLKGFPSYYSKSPLYSFALRFLFPTHGTSYSFTALQFTVKEKGGKPDRKPHPLLMA